MQVYSVLPLWRWKAQQETTYVEMQFFIPMDLVEIPSPIVTRNSAIKQTTFQIQVNVESRRELSAIAYWRCKSQLYNHFGSRMGICVLAT